MFIIGLFIGWIGGVSFFAMNWENLVSVERVERFYLWLVENGNIKK